MQFSPPPPLLFNKILTHQRLAGVLPFFLKLPQLVPHLAPRKPPQVLVQTQQLHPIGSLRCPSAELHQSWRRGFLSISGTWLANIMLIQATSCFLPTLASSHLDMRWSCQWDLLGQTKVSHKTNEKTINNNLKRQEVTSRIYCW